MAQAKTGDHVRVHYTGRLADGTVFDSSVHREALEFTLGQGQLIPGFERAVLGMQPGETKTVMVGSDDAYGPRQENLVVVVDRTAMPPQTNPTVGQRGQVRGPDGSTTVVTVTAVSDVEVTLDANHPLAGQDLTFEIQLLEIR